MNRPHADPEQPDAVRVQFPLSLNPVENPYVSCGQTRDKTAVSYMNRSRVRPGMVTPAVLAAFRSVGWGWGGSWFGSTKDYMHFSSTGN